MGPFRHLPLIPQNEQNGKTSHCIQTKTCGRPCLLSEVVAWRPPMRPRRDAPHAIFSTVKLPFRNLDSFSALLAEAIQQCCLECSLCKMKVILTERVNFDVIMIIN